MTGGVGVACVRSGEPLRSLLLSTDVEDRPRSERFVSGGWVHGVPGRRFGHQRGDGYGDCDRDRRLSAPVRGGPPPPGLTRPAIIIGHSDVENLAPIARSLLPEVAGSCSQWCGRGG